MARPNQTAERRREFLPVVATAFAELGYRRTTTAELARRCKVRENVLYRLWPDKKAMFIGAIEYVYELSANIWADLLGARKEDRSPAERLLDYESKHHGEFGLYRLVFAGLTETDDPEVREALSRMYGRFHGLIRRLIAAHRAETEEAGLPDASLSAWAIVGLGTVANIIRELGLMPPGRRKRFIAQMGRFLLEGAAK
jgi:AcrR family transcriptional regulator